jgi:hypothetical protein
LLLLVQPPPLPALLLVPLCPNVWAAAVPQAGAAPACTSLSLQALK